jgi:hypothetical protein
MATSGTFGIVETDNDVVVTGWQWEESATGGGDAGAPAGGFADFGTIITGFDNATTTEVTVRDATVAMSGTFVRCRADFMDGATPTSVYSNEAVLTVT